MSKLGLLWTVPILATLSLAACAPTISSDCPPIPAYDADFRARAAAELSLLPQDSALEEMLRDYAVLRAQMRACRA
jgi:hypothetical protein